MANDQTNFDIDQGADFRLDVELLDLAGDPVDVSAAVIIGQIRKTASSPTVEACFTIDPTDLAEGKFGIVLDALTTASLKCNTSITAQRTITQFAYDVEVHFADDTVTRILSGVLNVSPEVTHP